MNDLKYKNERKKEIDREIERERESVRERSVFCRERAHESFSRLPRLARNGRSFLRSPLNPFHARPAPGSVTVSGAGESNKEALDIVPGRESDSRRWKCPTLSYSCHGTAAMGSDGTRR